MVYYKKCSASQKSIVDALKSIGVDSSMTNRKKIAAANNISNYTGTAAQNEKMLNLLKQGKLSLKLNYKSRNLCKVIKFARLRLFRVTGT